MNAAPKKRTWIKWSCMVLAVVLGYAGAAIATNYIPINTVAQDAYNAGFRGNALVTAIAIAGAESSYDADAHCVNCDGVTEDSRGLWQINYDAHPNYDPEKLFDPPYNASAAFAISDNGTNFSAWTTYTYGTYLKYLAAAQAAANSVTGGDGGGGGGSSDTTVVSESDTAANDSSPGFTQFGSPPLHDATDVGDGGHCYWTYTNGSNIDNMGDWRPNLPQAGNYELLVYIPSNHGTTQQAHYEIYAADGRHNVTVNQLSYSNAWVSLGTFPFAQGSANYLRLTDGYSEAYDGHTEVCFDTAKWVPKSPPPPPTVTFSGTTNKWYGPADINTQVVTWTLQDTGGGIGGLSQNWDNDPGGSSPQFQGSHGGYMTFGYISDPAQRQGKHTAYVRTWSQDFSQSLVASAGWYGYDAVPPNVTVTSSQTGGSTYYSAQTVAFHVADPDSGMAGWGAAWDSDPGQKQSSASDGSSVLPAGTHTLHVHAWDNVGNSEDYTFGPYTLTPMPSVVSITLSPSTVAGGGSVTATATLAYPAPAGGMNVVFASTDDHIAGLPSSFFKSITVPAGATSAMCTVSTFAVASATTVLIKAATSGNGGEMVQATLTVVSASQQGSWAVQSIAAGTDGKTRLLWTKADGSASFWTVASGGQIAYSQTYGPYAGWTARKVAAGPNGATDIWWNTSSGGTSYWQIGASGTITYSPAYGPYAGWTPTDFSANGDGSVRLLWTSPSGAASYWTIAANGSVSYSPTFGPYSGWTTAHIASAPGGATRLLWNNANGAASVWSVSAGGAISYSPTYGPNAGWTCADIGVGNDDKTRLQWNSGGATSFWTLGANNSIAYSPAWGPYAGWSPVGFALAPDNSARLLWNAPSGASSYWSVTPGFGIVYSPTYGPY